MPSSSPCSSDRGKGRTVTSGLMPAAIAVASAVLARRHGVGRRGAAACRRRDRDPRHLQQRRGHHPAEDPLPGAPALRAAARRQGPGAGEVDDDAARRPVDRPRRRLEALRAHRRAAGLFRRRDQQLQPERTQPVRPGRPADRDRDHRAAARRAAGLRPGRARRLADRRPERDGRRQVPDRTGRRRPLTACRRSARAASSCRR